MGKKPKAFRCYKALHSNPKRGDAKPLRRLGDRFLDERAFDNQKVSYCRCLL
jgi:hypothetical protein